MSKILYIDGKFGVSGDMLCGALLDLGASEEKVRKALSSIEVQGFEVQIGRVKKAGLDACDFTVVLDEEHENHDHDMEFLHGHDHSHDHEHHHEHGHEHSHDHHHHHDHEHEHDHHHDHDHSHHHEHSHEHHHHHEHRGLADVTSIIDSADITPNARYIAKKIFNVLAEAEAKAHGTTVTNVHFHEVGAVDSIVDVITIAVCIDDLAPDKVVLKNLTDGSGTIRCQHGMMPVPVPAVANIVQRQKLELHISEIKGELVTPTGAAAVSVISTDTELPKSYHIAKIGIGAGKRTYEVPSILRVMLLEAKEESLSDRVVKLETNIDDCTGENLGYVMNKLMENGARDVYYTPIYMKKNRPAYLLSVICMVEDVEKLEEIIFRETTTIGIRRSNWERSILERTLKNVSTPYGDVAVKVCTLPDGEKRYYPEFESIKKLCENTGISYQEAYKKIINMF